jgi:hypothetical protein
VLEAAAFRADDRRIEREKPVLSSVQSGPTVSSCFCGPGWGPRDGAGRERRRFVHFEILARPIVHIGSLLGYPALKHQPGIEQVRSHLSVVRQLSEASGACAAGDEMILADLNIQFTRSYLMSHYHLL